MLQRDEGRYCNIKQEKKVTKEEKRGSFRYEKYLNGNK